MTENQLGDLTRNLEEWLINQGVTDITGLQIDHLEDNTIYFSWENSQNKLRRDRATFTAHTCTDSLEDVEFQEY